LPAAGSQTDDGAHGVTRPTTKLKPSALLDTRVVYRGDNLEQLAKLPDACVDLIYIDPPFNSNRNYGQRPDWHSLWGESKEKRAFEDRHENTKALIGSWRLGDFESKVQSFLRSHLPIPIQSHAPGNVSPR
jgi:hypothetical protein